MTTGDRQELIKRLQAQAKIVRIELLKMIYRANSGHPGGSLSAADVVTALYYYAMRVDPKNPRWDDRDRFILSKGHACPVLYTVLGLMGFYPKEDMVRLRQLGSPLQGHPDMKVLPGLDATTGSLGQGLSIGVGLALGAKLRQRDYRTYVLLGDGETDEGQVWEAAMAASKYKLDNLCAIVDQNGLQNDGPTDEIMPLGSLADKWKAFGWHVLEIDGHDMYQITEALDTVKTVTQQPSVILARTVKGKGVSFMENMVKWHSGAPTSEQLEQALCEIAAGREN